MDEESPLFLDIAIACQYHLNVPDIELVEALSDAVWLSQRLAIDGTCWEDNNHDNEQPLALEKDEDKLKTDFKSIVAKKTDDPQPKPSDDRKAVALMSGAGDAYAEFESSTASVPGRGIRFPGVPPLQGAREFERAWRPFAKKVPDWHCMRFNERATADQIAATLGTVWTIATKPQLNRRWQGVAIFERSPTMRFWNNALDEFYKSMWRTSAFNRLQIAYVDGFNSAPALYKNQNLTDATDLDSITSETDNEWIFFFTDFRSNTWLDGSMLELVRTWQSNTNVVIVHMMSEVHWLHSALSHFELIVAPGSHTLPHAKNGRLPIFSFEPQSLGNWVNWATGVSGSHATMMSLIPKRPFQNIAPIGRQQRSQEATQERADLLYKRFVQFASEPAQMLARSLASAPLQLPVMRLIQRCEVPDSTSTHLAEILYSGLIERRSEADRSTDPNTIEYDFLPGVRDKLLSNSSRHRIDRVLHLNWEYMQSRFGNGINFNAIIADPSQAERVAAYPIDNNVAPFARVGGRILQRLGGKQAEAGSKILDKVLRPRTDDQAKIRVDRLRMEYELLKVELEDGTNVVKGTIFHEAISRPIDQYVPNETRGDSQWRRTWRAIRQKFEELRNLQLTVSLFQKHVPSGDEPANALLQEIDDRRLFSGRPGLDRGLAQLITNAIPVGQQYEFRDADGKAKSTSAGEPFKYRLGLFRMYTVYQTEGDISYDTNRVWEQFQSLVKVASRRLETIPSELATSIWANWLDGFSAKQFEDESLWYDFVFEVLTNGKIASPAIDRFAICRDPSGEDTKIILCGNGLYPRLPAEISFEQFCGVPNQLGYPSTIEATVSDFVNASIRAIDCMLSQKTEEETSLDRSLVFLSFSYADDDKYRHELRTILKADKDIGGYFFDDLEVTPGSNWDEALRNAVARTRVMIMLVGPRYLDPIVCQAWKYEIPLALEAHAKNELTILWVTTQQIRASDTPFSHIQACHPPSRPLALLSDGERIEVYERIRDEARRIIAQHRKSLGIPSVTEAKALRVFISYSQDSRKHVTQVLRFSDQLRQDGIDASVDQYYSNPSEGWSAWLEGQIEQSDFILIVFTKQYDSQSIGSRHESGGTGDSENSILESREIYHSAHLATKIIPIVFENKDREWILPPLREQSVVVEQFDLGPRGGYQDLYRMLTNQQRTQSGVLPEIRHLPSVPKRLAVNGPTTTITQADDQEIEKMTPSELRKNLANLPPAMFEEIVFDMGAAHLIAAQNSAQSIRAIELVQVAQVTNNLDRLGNLYDEVTGKSLVKTTPKFPNRNVKVLIVGSYHSKQLTPERKAFEKACHELGTELVRAGYTIVGSSSRPSTTDYHVFEGANQSGIRGKVILVRPTGRDEADDFEKKVLSNLDVERKFVRGKHFDARPVQIEAANFVIAVGGEKGTAQVLQLADSAGKDVIPIGAFEGTARERWDAQTSRLFGGNGLEKRFAKLRERFDSKLIIELLGELEAFHRILRKPVSRKRFAVALSFPGEHREFIEQIAEELANEFGRDRVFYDEWYEVDLLGVGGDLKLQAMYDDADLVIPFFSTHYEKAWCAMEWETIRGILLNRRKDDAVIPVHLDETKIPGWSDVNFGIRRRNRSAKQIAKLIVQSHERRNTAAVKMDSVDRSTSAKSPVLKSDQGASELDDFWLASFDRLMWHVFRQGAQKGTEPKKLADNQGNRDLQRLVNQDKLTVGDWSKLFLQSLASKESGVPAWIGALALKALSGKQNNLICEYIASDPTRLDRYRDESFWPSFEKLFPANASIPLSNKRIELSLLLSSEKPRKGKSIGDLDPDVDYPVLCVPLVQFDEQMDLLSILPDRFENRLLFRHVAFEVFEAQTNISEETRRSVFKKLSMLKYIHHAIKLDRYGDSDLFMTVLWSDPSPHSRGIKRYRPTSLYEIFGVK